MTELLPPAPYCLPSQLQRVRMSEKRPPRDPSDAAAESTREAMDLGRLLSAGGTVAVSTSSHDAILSTLRQMLEQNLALPPPHVQLDTNLPRPQRAGSKPKGRRPPAPTPRPTHAAEDRKEVVSTGTAPLIRTSPQQNRTRVASSPAPRFVRSSTSSRPDSATITPASSFAPQEARSTNQMMRPRESVPNAALPSCKPIAPSPSQQQQLRQSGAKPISIHAVGSTTQPAVSIPGSEQVALHHAGLGALQQLLQAQTTNGVLPQSVLAALIAQSTSVPPVSLPDPPHLNLMLSFTVPTQQQPHLIPSTDAYATMQAFGHHSATAIPRNAPNPTVSVSLPAHSHRWTNPASRTGSSGSSSSVASIPSTMTPVAGLALAPLPIQAHMLPPQGSTEQQLQQLQYIQLLLALQQSSQSNPIRSFAGPTATTTTTPASSIIPMITTHPQLRGIGGSSALHLSMIAPPMSIGTDASMPADMSGRNKRKAVDAPRRGSSAGRTEPATLDEEDAIKRRRISQKQLDVLEAAYQDDPLPSRRTKQRLASQLSISTKRVQIWFQNRRAKQKRRSRGSGEEDGAFSEEVKSSPPTSDSSGM